VIEVSVEIAHVHNCKGIADHRDKQAGDLHDLMFILNVAN
jgi:hypothetical protein